MTDRQFWFCFFCFGVPLLLFALKLTDSIK